MDELFSIERMTEIKYAYNFKIVIQYVSGVHQRVYYFTKENIIYNYIKVFCFCFFNIYSNRLSGYA